MPKKMLSAKSGACALRLRAAIEGLEPRTLLSTWVVNSTADTNTAGTLRYYVNNSAAGDVITFDPSVFKAGSTQIIQLSGQQLEISHNLTIQGPGADHTYVDAEFGSRDFHIDSGVTAAISGLAITRGDSSATDSIGGGISNDGTLTLTNSWITGNNASQFGGGLSNQGTATLIDDTFSQDTTGDGTTIAGGGALANTGSLVMEESTVTTSSSTGNGTASDTPGAILFRSGTATITGCTIANNTVGLNQNGGGTVTLTNDIIAENQIDLTSTGVQATYTGSYNVIGKDTTGTMTAGNHNNIVGQNVNPGLGPMGYYGGHTLVYSLQTGSPAIDTGSNALVPIGINNDQRGNIRIVNGTVDIGSYEFGGPPLTNPPPLVVNTTNDGADYVQGILTLRQAITIANAQSTPQTITFDPTVFTAGTQHVITLVNGLELEISNTAAEVDIQGPGQGVVAVNGANNSRIFLIDGGVKSRISGMTLFNGAATTSGGAIDDEGTLTLTDSSILNSSASGANGGGIYAAFGPLTLSNVTLTGNAASNGGALYATAGSDPVITNSTISNNTAPGGSGGGIDAQGPMTLTNSTVSGNSVGQAGGGLAIAGGVAINSSTISGNSADGGLGGGIYATGNGQLTITNSTIYGNSAAGSTGRGGGIYVLGSTKLLVDNSTIVSNTSGSGGGLYLAGGDTSLYNTIVAQNTASVTGGAKDIFNTLDSGGPVGPQASSNNLIDDAASAGGLADATSGNIVGHAAMIGTLANNGGPTQTVLPLTGSPAIDAGSNALANDYSGSSPVALTTDQRGGPRIVNGIVDIGSVEVQAALAAPTNLVATAGADEVDLSWTAVSGASGYEIFRGTSTGGESTTPLATVSSPSYLDTQVTAGTKYFYIVEAVSGPTVSAPSAEASATPFLPVINANPAGDTITLSLDPDGLHVDWTNLATSGKVLINDPIGLTINGQGGIDTITLTGSGVPIPKLLTLNSGAGNFTLNGLPSTGDPLAGKTLDLGTSTLYVGYSGTSPEQLIRQDLRNGLVGQTSDRIISSAATLDYTIGYADAAETNSPNTHAGTVELKYAVYGDANLDGTVNLADFLAVSRNFGQTNSTWLAGDFNYDGATNLTDLLILVRHFGRTAPPPPPAAAALSFASNPVSGPLAARRR